MPQFTTTHSHPGYAPWERPTETYVDRDGQPDTRDLPQDFFLRHPKIPPLPPKDYRRPRQCLIEDNDAIPFSEAKKILEHNWNATPAEIVFWVSSACGNQPLHVFTSYHEVFSVAFGRRFYRRKPGGEGRTRLCVPFGSQDEPDDCTDAERLSHYLFSRAEIEEFDPALNDDDSAAEIEYYVDGTTMGGGWFNPSGRYLSFEQAVDFLCRYEPDRDIVAGIIRREFRRDALNAFNFKLPGFWLNISPNARPEDGHFFEGQIVGLAKEEFGADVRRWDAASHPEDDHEARPQQGHTATRRYAVDRHIHIILEAIRKAEYPEQDIPYGGRAAIGRALINARSLTKDQFKKAWQAANNRELIRVKDKEKYSQKT